MPDLVVIFGGPSPEHDVSVLTGLQATHELLRNGESVRALYWTKTGEWYEVAPDLEGKDFVEGVPRGSTPLRLLAGPGGGFSVEGSRLRAPRPIDVDVAIVCCHGGPGEDGTLQGALDLAGIRYTGPTVAGAALGMDKLAFSGVMAAAGLPVLPRLLLSPTSEPPPFDGPYIVKPRFGGSSIGIEILADIDSARARLSTNPHLNQGAIIEPFRSDMFDLQVGVKSWPIKSISQIERPLKSSSLNPFLTYAEKYVGGAGMATAPREFPASIDPLLAQKLRTTADAASDLLSIRGLARLDFLSDGHDLVINEVNTIPGSLSHYLWKSPDTSFYKLIHEMMTEARERGTHSYSAAGADGRVLSESTEIASKLA